MRRIVERDTGDAESHESQFEGEPLVGHTKLTVEDFTTVWTRLPHTRSVAVRLFLWVLAFPFFALVTAILNGQASGEPIQLPWLYGVVPVLLGGALAFGLWRGRTRWAENAVADLRGGEGVEFR